MNNKTKLVFELVQSRLPSVSIARGNYAYIGGKRVGLHTDGVTHLDLAAMLFLAAEQVDNNNRDALFRECWTILRNHLSWDKRQNTSDAKLCAYLDNHSKEWHAMVVAQLINGTEYSITRTMKNEGELSEYV